MLSRVKQDCNQFPCISDPRAVAKSQALKAQYDEVSLRRGEDDPLFVEELSETFSFASPDYEETILGDPALGPTERKQKLDILHDYLDLAGTRSLAVQPESDRVRRRRDQHKEGDRQREEERDNLRKQEADRVAREQRRKQQAEQEQARIQQEGLHKQPERKQCFQWH